MEKRRSRRWTDEQLEDAVAKSVSYAEILRRLNYGLTGGNHVYIKAKIKELGFDTAHIVASNRILTQKQLDGLSKRKTLSREEVLCHGSKAPPGTIKKWALLLLPNECAECKIPPIYNGKQLTLQLHHLNGINNDNVIENLQLLCPNCHSQTSSYSRSIIQYKGKRCCDCSIKISSKATRCANCNHIFRFRKSLNST